MSETTRRRKARDLSYCTFHTVISGESAFLLPASARMNALLRGCRRAVRGFIMAALAQIMAVLRRPSPAHLETSSGGEPAELVRLSLCELSLMQSIISMLQVFLRPSAPQVPLCTAGGSLASASARISIAVSVGEPRFLPKFELVSRQGLV